jgi:ferric-dicitrate binding protein FerR (iron transport regulator)
MNNESPSNSSKEMDFEAWLRADEVPSRPTAHFRERLHGQINGAARSPAEADVMQQLAPQGSLWQRWLAGTAAAAAVLILILSLQGLLPTPKEPTASIWLAAEMELYASMLDAIDAETLSELVGLLDFYQ